MYRNARFVLNGTSAEPRIGCVCDGGEDHNEGDFECYIY